jgi:cysteine dioxygenase
MPTTRRIEDFVDLLRGFAPEKVTSSSVLDLCLDTDIEDSSLSKYVHWQDSMYTRNLIYRDDLFEVMAVCWQKGQKTVLHTHNGQLGWMMVNRGIAEVTNFKWQGCNAAEGQNTAGLDCIAGATEIQLSRDQVETCGRGGQVNVIDRVRTIHQVAVAGNEPVVSIHVYSRPIDSCVAFDTESPRCYRRQLRYYSKFGDVLMTPADVTGLTAAEAKEPSTPLLSSQAALSSQADE